jgi:7,8-dihydropterin-6-yl-methyl-4-(beta-D-ribofuranosyl)aminobenzene 5'-phosphate synthase
MKTLRRNLAIIFCLSMISGLSAGWAFAGPGETPEVPPPLTLTVLYDNTTAVPGTEADWGFSCLIRGTEKTILLDVGGKHEVLFKNLEVLKVDPKEVQIIALSHAHSDHTGALVPFLIRDEGAEIYAPFDWPEEYLPDLPGTTVREPMEICRNVYLTGATGKSPVEQALVLNTEDGLVVVTGCAHPGIVSMVERAKEMLDRPVDLVCGGFHLLNMSDEQVMEIIGQLRALGVQRVGATHCTGEKQIALIREAYGAGFVPLAVGRVLEFRIAPVGLSIIVKDGSGRIVDSRREYVLKNVARFVEENKGVKQGGVVMLGDSITEGWPAALLPAGVANRGIGGDKVGGRYYGVRDRLKESVFDLGPRKVYFLIGINNIIFWPIPVPELLDNYDKLLGEMKAGAPGTKIVVQSLLPLNMEYASYNPTVLAANKGLKQLARKHGCSFLDLYARFADAKGELPADLSDDGLHLNAKGYVKWAKLVPEIAKALPRK